MGTAKNCANDLPEADQAASKAAIAKWFGMRQTLVSSGFTRDDIGDVVGLAGDKVYCQEQAAKKAAAARNLLAAQDGGGDEKPSCPLDRTSVSAATKSKFGSTGITDTQAVTAFANM